MQFCNLSKICNEQIYVHTLELYNMCVSICCMLRNSEAVARDDIEISSRNVGPEDNDHSVANGASGGCQLSIAALSSLNCTILASGHSQLSLFIPLALFY